MDLNTIPNKGVATLEAELELCQEQARKALARAEAVDPRLDEYGHAATNANADALRFLRMSAKLALALGKLKGEHTNNINVRKTETVERAPVPEHRKPYVPLVSRPPDPEREARVQKIYDDWVAAEAARVKRGARMTKTTKRRGKRRARSPKPKGRRRGTPLLFLKVRIAKNDPSALSRPARSSGPPAQAPAQAYRPKARRPARQSQSPAPWRLLQMRVRRPRLAEG